MSYDVIAYTHWHKKKLAAILIISERLIAFLHGLRLMPKVSNYPTAVTEQIQQSSEVLACH